MFCDEYSVTKLSNIFFSDTYSVTQLVRNVQQQYIKYMFTQMHYNVMNQWFNDKLYCFICYVVFSCGFMTYCYILLHSSPNMPLS